MRFVGRAAAVAADPVNGSGSLKPSRTDKPPAKSSYAAYADVDCPVCEGGHEVPSCPSFLKESPGDRLQAALRAKLCFMCLRTGHITRECPDKTTCPVQGCQHWHAGELHEANWAQFRRSSRRQRTARKPEEPQAPPSTPSDPPVPEVHYSTSFHARCSKVGLPLLPVKVSSAETGATVETYALLDSGSNISLCQDHLLESLGATGRPETMRLTTLEKANSQSRLG